MKGSWAGLQVKSYAGEESDTGLEKAAGRPLPSPGMCEGPRPAPPARRPAGGAAPAPPLRRGRATGQLHGPGPLSLRINGTD